MSIRKPTYSVLVLLESETLYFVLSGTIFTHTINKVAVRTARKPLWQEQQKIGKASADSCECRCEMRIRTARLASCGFAIDQHR